MTGDHAARLLERLDAIGRSLAATGDALALLGLGSVGVELDRLDEYSDLDFFAVVRPGHKQAFVEDLGWLAAVAPIAYAFRNTPDGCKLLYEDGVFCEFAVFEPPELAGIPYAPGRVVWAAEGFDLAALGRPTAPSAGPVDVAWQLGEALTNLYVGLARFRRGEKLTAARFVQGYAVDRVLELAALVEEAAPSASRDPFQVERRVEQRLPQVAALLPQFVQGYERTPESARAILAFLEARFEVNPGLRQLIVGLSEPAPEHLAKVREGSSERG